MKTIYFPLKKHLNDFVSKYLFWVLVNCCRSSLTEYNSFINSKSNSTKETLVKSPIRHIKISGNKIIFSEAVYLAVDTFQNKPKEEYNRRKYMRRLRFCVRLTLTTGRPNCFFLVSECTKGPVHTYNNSLLPIIIFWLDIFSFYCKNICCSYL